MAMSAEAYRAQLQALLPQGAAWPRESNTVLARFLAALAEEIARVDGRAEQLLDETDPRTTAELLADWERVAGLPDSCVTATQTTQERRAALVAKLTNLGGQSRQFFIDLAARLGYTVTITEFRQYHCERDCGQPVNEEDWQFVWQVNAPETTVREFSTESGAEDPLRSWGDELLECMFQRLKPAQTKVQFTYA